jgi:ribonuclease M5
MKRIRQLIVVEGRHDSAALKKYFDCDTIETGGTSLDETVFEQILEAKEKRGVIIFTDPDSPGNRIRNEINQRIPGCENAFIDKSQARTEHKVGVEHASYEAIAEALENLGAKTILIYTEEEKLETYGRMDPARYGYADVYICCHANSIAESSPANLWCGTYVYYHYDHSSDFAKRLCDYISASTNRDNEGAHADYYSVTRLTMCPAVMLEVGFVSNPMDLESLIDKRDIQKTAFAVTKAVLEICDN